jgi:hypothetical protein
MKNEDETETGTAETTPAETKADKPKKSSKSKAATKKKVAAKTKQVAKKAKSGNGKEKEKKVAKRSAVPAERDQFGFRKGSKKSQAAALYATKKGATLNEVKEKTGSSQLNLLTELKNRKMKVLTSKEKGTGKKQVTRYKIVIPEKAAKAAKAAPAKENGEAAGEQATN